MAVAMSTFDELGIGTRFRTPTRALDDDLHRDLVRLGGYVHPLFTDKAHLAASPFDRVPFPGQALLLVMGGLIESSGRFDETVIALVGFDNVRFHQPGYAGDAVSVDVEVIDKELRSEGARGLLTMDWRCRNARGDTLVEATARMLFRRRHS